jgi:hypothetical protein
MRYIKGIHFNVHPHPRNFAVAPMEEIGFRGKDLHKLAPYYLIRLPDGDPRLDRLTEFLDREGIDWHVSRYAEYTSEELQQSELLELGVARGDRGEIGPKYGTEYDMSTGCPACGTGAVQISPPRLSRSKLPTKGRMASTFGGGYLIEHTLAIDLSILLRSTEDLRQVEDRRTLEKLPWWQIHPRYTMPRMHESTSGITTDKDQCKVCRREGYFNVREWPLEPVYRRSELPDTLPDLANSWECFGHTSVKIKDNYQLFATPSVFVSNRVMRFLQERKVKEARFYPIRLVDE